MARRKFGFEDDEIIDDYEDPDDDMPFMPSARTRLALRAHADFGLSLAEAERHEIRRLELGVELEPAPVPSRALVQWAEQQGLSRALSAPATELERWIGWGGFTALLSRTTLEQCALGKSSSLPRELRAAAPAVATAARNQVQFLAYRARLEEFRATAWARVLPGALGSLASALRAFRDRVLAAPEHQGPVIIADAAVVLGDDPPRAVAIFPNPVGLLCRVEIVFAGHAQGRVSASCNCHQKPFCGHQRVLVEALLDAIFGETALGVELADLAVMPAWQRLLGALAGARRTSDEPEMERLAWRLGREAQGLIVQPVVQQRNSRGVWSQGRKIAGAALSSQRLGASRRDRAAIDLLLACDHLRHFGGFGPAQVRVLEALVGHPRVSSLLPPYAPLELRKAAVAVSGVLHAGQLEIGLSVGGQRISVDQLPELMLDEHWGISFSAGQAALFELPVSVSRVLSVIRRYGIALPPEAHDRAAEVLASLSEQVPLELPEMLRGRRVQPRAQFVLRLSPRGGRGLEAELRVRVFEDREGSRADAPPLGADQVPGRGALDVFGSVGEERIWARRELEQEAARAGTMAERLSLPAAADDSARWWLDGDASLELVHRARELSSGPSRELLVEWPASEPWQIHSASPRQVHVKVERIGEWFSIGGSVELDELDVSLVEMLFAVRSGQRFIEVGPGRFARIEAELAAAASQIDDMTHVQGDRLLLGRASVASLESLGLPHLDGAEEWCALLARIEAASQLEPEPPSTLQAELRPYQRDGYRWLARLSAWDAGACLADDMGLGKTVQCLAVLLSRPGPHLVVAPTSVGPNWLREAQTFAPSLRARLYRGPERASLLTELAPGDLIVTNYDVLSIDAEALGAIDFDTLVLDEAQAVKNARTQRARAARSIRARFRLALTGTPVENHLGELWSICSIVSPGLLGPWEHFRNRFAAPIERDGDRGRLQALSRLIRPFVLRRTKAVVAPELPSRTSVIEPVELSAPERTLYEVARRQALSELGSATGERDRIQILAALTRLRRLACHPKLVASDYRGRASKLDTLLRLIDELRESGQRALVFSQFTSFLALVREALNAKGIGHLYLDGQTKLSEREALVDAWRRCDADFFLLSLKAGGSGLNLIGADAVIHLDPWWNPAVEDQATDRTHRIGQERPVTAIRLIAQGTIEEAVISLHDDKRSLSDGLLEGTEAAGKLSSRELVDLIRFGEGVEASSDDDASTEPDAATLQVADSERAQLLDAEKLMRLREPLARRLCEEDLLDDTCRAYSKAFDKLIEVAKLDKDARSLDGWRDACVLALRTGRLQGPRSLPSQLSAVLRRAENVLMSERRLSAATRERRSPRSGPP